jgi:hypothetical protein
VQCDAKLGQNGLNFGRIVSILANRRHPGLVTVEGIGQSSSHGRPHATTEAQRICQASESGKDTMGLATTNIVALGSRTVYTLLVVIHLLWTAPAGFLVRKGHVF